MSRRAVLNAFFALLALFFIMHVLADSAAWAQSPESAEPPGSASDTQLVGSDAETEVETPIASDAPQKSPPPLGFIERIDQVFGILVGWLSFVLFFDFFTGPWTDWNGVSRPGWLRVSIPFVVLWLITGAIILTARMGLINVRAFWHAVRVTKGDYDNPNDAGEVSHFQALSSALSATVGLGNIAGVAIAVSVGGPGAVFWMIAAGLFGMTSKFAECTLGQMYRKVDLDGRVSGGPMRYLYAGLAEKGWAPLGRVLSIVFAFLCIGGSFGGGCAFQVSQAKNLVMSQIEYTTVVDGQEVMRNAADTHGWAFGLVMVVLVGIVIIGGIRRIASTAEKIVPLMCGIYVCGAVAILIMNIEKIPATFAHIVSEAFFPQAAFGGVIGVMVTGIRRAAFSNEAGTGSAAIAHSAARTEHPVREGVVALLEPFIDTVVVCTMTGLVIVITGVYNDPQYAHLVASSNGSQLTSAAFGQEISWFPYILLATVFLFAYSTMISWSYYGERCFTFLFGTRTSMLYRLLFLMAIFVGSVVNTPNALDFSDLMILSMALPNMLGLLLLSGKVRQALNDYWDKYKRGEFVEYNKLGK